MESFKRGIKAINKIRENKTLMGVFLVVGLAILVVNAVWLDLPLFIQRFLNGIAICLIVLGGYEDEADKKKADKIK